MTVEGAARAPAAAHRARPGLQFARDYSYRLAPVAASRRRTHAEVDQQLGGILTASEIDDDVPGRVALPAPLGPGIY